MTLDGPVRSGGPSPEGAASCDQHGPVIGHFGESSFWIIRGIGTLHFLMVVMSHSLACLQSLDAELRRGYYTSPLAWIDRALVEILIQSAL